MARTSTYLNFPYQTDEAFNFYKSVFGGEFENGGIARFGDMPPEEETMQLYKLLSEGGGVK
jgi:PhnB protein